MIIPSIDLMDGKAVQLQQGQASNKIVEKENVLALAKEFSKYGEIAVIDLDAALGKGNNIEIIKKLCKIADCRVGGGIRTIEKANEILQAGAKKIIIGTNASPEFLKQLPKDRLIVAIDTKDGVVVTKGWTEKTGKTPEQAIQELEPYCSEFLFTNVNKEGMMQGFDIEKVKTLRNLAKNKITAAGGITSKEDICLLEDLGVNSQIGMALYTGKINLIETFVNLLDFEKGNGFIPTIVQEVNGQVLMLAYSTKASLAQAFELGKATYYSRSRKQIWTKGDTSGNKQDLMSVRYDCDRDTLLFTVKQKNVACHEGGYSCFGEKLFCLRDLYNLLVDRVQNPQQGSYTSRIAQDEQKIKAKIREEAEELVNYTDRTNLIWELADLRYFMKVLMAKNNITPEEVKNELWRRRK